MNGGRKRLRVLFAPDYREGVPYQSDLAKALSSHGVDVVFPTGYRRVMPLSRIVREFRPDIVHLHWPEGYCPHRPDILNPLRIARLPLDTFVSAQMAPLVVTAHNLFPHNRSHEPGMRTAVSAVYRQAAAVIAHSEAAAEEVVAIHAVRANQVRMIPIGDLSPALGPLPDREWARQALGLSEKPVCLMFGRVEPYKGIDEVVDFWNAARPDVKLCLVGHTDEHDPYFRSLQSKLSGNPSIRTVFRHVPDKDLAMWLAAADCTIFNYQQLLTSGAASLARSCGVPLLIPSRLRTVDLREPDPRVFRFENIQNLKEILPRALAVGSDYAAAAPWREFCSWDRIAQQTSTLYSFLLV